MLRMGQRTQNGTSLGVPVNLGAGKESSFHVNGGRVEAGDEGDSISLGYVV